VEGCHVIDTGESADATAPAFSGARHGIVVLWALGARVRGCEVASKPLIPGGGLSAPINSASRAVRMWAIAPAVILALLKAVGRPMVPFVDATDNIIEQSVAILVEILVYLPNGAIGETTFASNRCMNFAGGDFPAVVLAASHATITGNRVRKQNDNPSLAVYFSVGLSAVGNMTTGGAFIFPTAIGATQMPAPYTTFNISA
jgi:hypothetical protein